MAHPRTLTTAEVPAADAKAGTNPQDEAAKIIEKMKHDLTTYINHPNVKGHPKKIAAANAWLQALTNGIAFGLKRVLGDIEFELRIPEKQSAIKAPRLLFGESKTGIALIASLSDDIKKVRALLYPPALPKNKANKRVQWVTYQPAKALVPIERFALDDQNRIHAVVASPTDEQRFTATYALDEKSMQVNGINADAKAVAQSNGSLVWKHILPDGRIILITKQYSIQLVGHDNKIETQGLWNPDAHHVANILSINQNEYLIHTLEAGPRHSIDKLFLLPKNQLAAWIKQGFKRNPHEISLHKLNIPEFRTYLHDDIVIPQDDIIVMKYSDALQICKIKRDQSPTELELIFTHTNANHLYNYHRITLIRPGYFAVIMHHPGFHISTDNYVSQHDLIEEWNINAILNNINSGKPTHPYRSSKQFIVNKDSLKFLEDGRSAVSISGERERDSGCFVHVHDLEHDAKLFDEHQCTVNIDYESGYRVTDSRRQTNGQYTMALSKNSTLQSIIKFSFPAVEEHCRVIPRLISACHPEAFPPGVVAIITRGFLGMFHHKDADKPAASPQEAGLPEPGI